MGYIKEPVGIDFMVDPTPLSMEDRDKISEVIAFYRATGQKMSIRKSSLTVRIKSTRKRVIW
jgi:hypothetical protein